MINNLREQKQLGVVDYWKVKSIDTKKIESTVKFNLNFGELGYLLFRENY